MSPAVKYGNIGLVIGSLIVVTWVSILMPSCSLNVFSGPVNRVLTKPSHKARFLEPSFQLIQVADQVFFQATSTVLSDQLQLPLHINFGIDEQFIATPS
jgi:hypothetical protein